MQTRISLSGSTIPALTHIGFPISWMGLRGVYLLLEPRVRTGEFGFFYASTNVIKLGSCRDVVGGFECLQRRRA